MWCHGRVCGSRAGLWRILQRMAVIGQCQPSVVSTCALDRRTDSVVRAQAEIRRDTVSAYAEQRFHVEAPDETSSACARGAFLPFVMPSNRPLRNNVVPYLPRAIVLFLHLLVAHYVRLTFGENTSSSFFSASSPSTMLSKQATIGPSKVVCPTSRPWRASQASFARHIESVRCILKDVS